MSCNFVNFFFFFFFFCLSLQLPRKYRVFLHEKKTRKLPTTCLYSHLGPTSSLLHFLCFSSLLPFLALLFTNVTVSAIISILHGRAMSSSISSTSTVDPIQPKALFHISTVIVPTVLASLTLPPLAACIWASMQQPNYRKMALVGAPFALPAKNITPMVSS